MKKKLGVLCGRRLAALLAINLSVVLSFQFAQAKGQSGRQHLEQRGAQEEPQGERAQGEEDVLRVRTEEVLLPVSVRDAAGLPVKGLGKESFFIYDNGVRQEIE